ncbi:unnamed protein product [Soboliphyme baturini]|uniref:SHSP domain-containing protein n=1 Tax=Soboliphyme baturini TaxID=241478 RepID=A0A183IES9_9BILA|nr:unnamed protein product [Soboliphyme baturini]
MAEQIYVPLTHEWSADMWDWPLQNDSVVKVINTSDLFEVALDAPFFTPKEIEVKVLGNELIIHCAHEQRKDEFGYIVREIHRCYKLPLDIDTKSLKSHLTPKGILIISALKKKPT